jgi:large subunit ribosomal protein L22
MESNTYIKNVKVSPRKLRFLLPGIKKLSPSTSLDYLLYSPQKGAKVFYSAIHSAISNAKNTLKVSPDLLQFKTLTIEEGNVLKRYNPGGRGTAKPFKRRMAHIKITLTAKEPVETVIKPEVKVVKPSAVKSKIKMQKSKVGSKVKTKRKNGTKS